jgi:predicted GIY-YIG superfamily endonuclease
MHYTYVLYSEKDCEWYTGATSDLCRSNLLTLKRPIAGSQLTTSAATFKLERHLRARVREHAEGRVRSTEQRRPLLLAYYQACLNREDAFRRERYLKTGRKSATFGSGSLRGAGFLAGKSWNGTSRG